ncbi:MAG: hypothetical protein A2X08_12050 [Bacteroidetes bacterium GWA2_32_17]|nr:MAG: hypothetical protein A2X08_12050 [Bacteroidetes bacterium GWA2_32_17]
MRQILLLSIITITLFACENAPKKVITNDNQVKNFIYPKNATPIVYIGYIFIQGKADNVKGNFLLDLGTDNLHFDSLFFSENIFDYKNIKNIKLWGIGNSFQRATLIKDTVNFQFNKNNYKTSNVLINNLKPIGGDFVDGLIGIDYFKQGVLEINYHNKYIIIYQSIDSVDVSDYKLVSIKKIENYFCMQMEVKINDSVTIKGNFIIDTGMPFSALTNYVAQKNNLDKKVERKVRYYTKYGGIGGESSGFDFIADSLQISNFHLKNVNLSFSVDKSGILAGGEYLGIIGNNILERFDIIIDFKKSNLYLKPNENFYKPFISNRLGFFYIDRGKTMGGWIVTGLSEKSEAEKKGLKIDDKIISVNGIPIEKIPFETQEDYFKKIDKVKLLVKSAGITKIIEFKLEQLLK